MQTNMTDQSWIFLFEPMSSATYSFHTQTLTQVQGNGFNLLTFLLAVGLQPSSREQVNFWIKSNSLKPAVFIPDDEALFTVYQKHCQHDPVVTIIVRPSDDPSPGSSNQPNALFSFIERIRVTGHTWNASGVIAPDRVKHLERLATDHPSFENNAKKFIQDLVGCHAAWMSVDAKRIARRRLVSAGQPFYLGRPYFSEQAVLDILATPVQCYTLQKVLNVVATQAALGGENEHAVCELCTLAPLFVYAFGWTWESIVDLELSLQQTDHGKHMKKDHGVMCILKRKFIKLVS